MVSATPQKMHEMLSQCPAPGCSRCDGERGCKSPDCVEMIRHCGELNQWDVAIARIAIRDLTFLVSIGCLFESSTWQVEFRDGGGPQHKRMFLIHDVLDCGEHCSVIRQFAFRTGLGPPCSTLGLLPFQVEGSAAVAFETLKKRLWFRITGNTHHNMAVIGHDRDGEEFPIAEGCSLLKLRQQHFGLFEVDSNGVADEILSSVLFQRWQIFVVFGAGNVMTNLRAVSVTYIAYEPSIVAR